MRPAAVAAMTAGEPTRPDHAAEQHHEQGQSEVRVQLGVATGQPAGILRTGEGQRGEGRVAGDVGEVVVRRKRCVRRMPRAFKLEPNWIREDKPADHHRERNAGQEPRRDGLRPAPTDRRVHQREERQGERGEVEHLLTQEHLGADECAQTERSDQRVSGSLDPGQLHHAPHHRWDQPLRGHVQVAVGLRDHARGKASKQTAHDRRAAVKPESPSEQEVPTGRRGGEIHGNEQRERYGGSEQYGHRRHDHTVQDVRGVAHQVHAVGRVQPGREQRKVALPDEYAVAEEPLDEGLVVDVLRDRPRGRIRPQVVGEPGRKAEVDDTHGGIEGAPAGAPQREPGPGRPWAGPPRRFRRRRRLRRGGALCLRSRGGGTIVNSDTKLLGSVFDLRLPGAVRPGRVHTIRPRCNAAVSLWRGCAALGRWAGFRRIVRGGSARGAAHGRYGIARPARAVTCLRRSTTPGDGSDDPARAFWPGQTRQAGRKRLTLACPPGWWNGRHGCLKSGCLRAYGFESRPGHTQALR